MIWSCYLPRYASPQHNYYKYILHGLAAWKLTSVLPAGSTLNSLQICDQPGRLSPWRLVQSGTGWRTKLSNNAAVSSWVQEKHLHTQPESQCHWAWFFCLKGTSDQLVQHSSLRQSVLHHYFTYAHWRWTLWYRLDWCSMMFLLNSQGIVRLEIYRRLCGNKFESFPGLVWKVLHLRRLSHLHHLKPWRRELHRFLAFEIVQYLIRVDPKWLKFRTQKSGKAFLLNSTISKWSWRSLIWIYISISALLGSGQLLLLLLLKKSLLFLGDLHQCERCAVHLWNSLGSRGNGRICLTSCHTSHTFISSVRATDEDSKHVSRLLCLCDLHCNFQSKVHVEAALVLRQADFPATDSSVPPCQLETKNKQSKRRQK